jgi:hypothetical protein
MVMIKALIFGAAVCFSLSAIASEGKVLGVADGQYSGSGILKSQSMIIPNMRFESSRELSNGVIEAHTKAYLLGHVVAEAKASLQVIEIGDGYLKLRDLNTGEIAGDGRCDDQACTFTATVMNGELTLTETWIPTEDGFEAVECSQEFKGTAAVYEASFSKN